MTLTHQPVKATHLRLKSIQPLSELFQAGGDIDHGTAGLLLQCLGFFWQHLMEIEDPTPLLVLSRAVFILGESASVQILQTALQRAVQRQQLTTIGLEFLQTGI